MNVISNFAIPMPESGFKQSRLRYKGETVRLVSFSPKRDARFPLFEGDVILINTKGQMIVLPGSSRVVEKNGLAIIEEIKDERL